MSTPKIVTSHVFPPMPSRENDWCAHYEGEEEAGNYGWGATEWEAVLDFIDNCKEAHDERLGFASAPTLSAENERLKALVAEMVEGMEPAAAFADALNERVPDDIALGIFADGGMRFGPSGGMSVGHLRRARALITRAKAAS